MCFTISKSRSTKWHLVLNVENRVFMWENEYILNKVDWVFTHFHEFFVFILEKKR